MLTVKDFPTIPMGWTLTYDERSNGVYQVRLTSERGPQVETTGAADLEQLVLECIKDAKAIDEQLQQKYG
ncbi:hypothetical protein [Hymenobacter norwichensis]|uniref:hypothetical protein n=1 Tax=Hymenobacter norwichensis TaxID=223903 RepID=UPI0003B60EDF|nr:hypothetical protein [Hymenobacter norwichensis]